MTSWPGVGVDPRAVQETIKTRGQLQAYTREVHPLVKAKRIAVGAGRAKVHV